MVIQMFVGVDVYHGKIAFKKKIHLNNFSFYKENLLRFLLRVFLPPSHPFSRGRTSLSK